MSRKYKLDETLLDNIDMEWKAYFLGILAADGCIRKNRLQLKLKDLQILQDIKLEMNYKIPIRKEDHQNRSSSFILNVFSKKIQEQVAKYGLVERKTTKLKKVPDKIPQHLKRHFIRGYFDGDGTIGWKTSRPNQVQINIASVQKCFLENMQEFLITEGIKTKIYLEKRNGKMLSNPQGKMSDKFLDMWRLTFNTHESKEKFYELCWINSSISLTRKKDIFARYYKTRTFYNIHKSNKYPWEEIYSRYMLGEEVPTLSREYGFYPRSLYTWMNKTNKTYRTKVAPPTRNCG